jgi:hypothetical protein
MKNILLLSLLFLFCVATSAQSTASRTSLPTKVVFDEAKIRKDLFDMAGDHFKGREAGTLDELKVAMWLANQAKAAGLEPAGDDSTYFQFFTLVRNRVSAASTVMINDRRLKLWDEVLIMQTAAVNVNAPVLVLTAANWQTADVQGKAVAMPASTEGINLNVSLPERRYPGYVARKYATELIRKGAAAVIFLADEMGEKSWSQVRPSLERGTYDIPGGSSQTVAARAPIIWMHASSAETLRSPGAKLLLNVSVDQFEYPSVNVLGKITGKDPVLNKEFVLFSGHHDHDGIRQPYGSDSIYNGADDNASVSVALLAIARAFKSQRAGRSALFVWHGAEERGLLGSRWYVANPTVPKASIVAVLNGDMIGRNRADSAALLGAQAPHRNSPELVSMALAANNEGPAFKLDTLWDKPTHVEGWYFRSDHLPYARAGIPSLFYTTLLHGDYHTPMDEPKTMDVHKIARVSEWMFRTGMKVANTPKKPALDPAFRLER